MSFMDSYKHLDKICREIFDEPKGVTAYINEMKNIYDGMYYVNSWEEDLNNLKYCRFVRNRIAHDVACTEENMCSSDEVVWLDNFYSRILNQTDPLSLYRISKSDINNVVTASEKDERLATSVHTVNKTAKSSVGCSTFLFLAVGIITAIVLLISYI